MKRITMMLILFSMFLFGVGCTSDKAVDSKRVLPDDIPNFVRESDFETIDWERKAMEFSEFVYKDKMMEGASFGQREKDIEADIKALFSEKDFFQSKLEDSLNGVYMNEEGTVVVDFQHFGALIGHPSHGEIGDLMNALNDVIFKNTKTKEIYYTFEGNFTSFGDWTEVGENVYKRD